MRRTSKQLSAIAAFLSVFITGTVYAVQPILSEPVITDVSDRSFSLVWTTDQPGQSSIELYSDAAGTVPVTSGVTSLPYIVHTGNPAYDELNRQPTIDAIVTAARAMGVVKITMTGLSTATTYYIKYSVLSDTTLETTLCPDAGAAFCPDTPVDLLQVTTEQFPARTNAVPDLFTNNVLLKLNATAQSGELVIVAAETTSYPVSAFVGDGVPAPYSVLDLNNLYSSAINSTHELAGSSVQAFGDIGEGLVIRHYKGINGSETSMYAAATNQGTGALMTPLNRDPGDCNNDGRIDSYDHQLLASVIAGVVTEPDYALVAFHPVLCNLYKESGLHSVDTTVVLDGEDETRHIDLLIGKTPASSLPEAP